MRERVVGFTGMETVLQKFEQGIGRRVGVEAWDVDFLVEAVEEASGVGDWRGEVRSTNHDGKANAEGIAP